MYQVGDLIVYGGTGVCRVMEVGPQTGGRLYYTLEPVYGSCRIFTPVENSKVLMRPIVTRQEAERLIDEIPAIQPEAYYNKALQRAGRCFGVGPGAGAALHCRPGGSRSA